MLVVRADNLVERRTKPRTRAATASQTVAGDPAEPEQCSHAWEIDRPNQQISHGRCSKCGAEKDFLNYGEELRMPFGRRRRS